MRTRTDCVAPLTGAGWDVQSVGGKGAWLDRLAAGGFPVPPAAAITTEAYHAVAATDAVADLISRLRSSPIPDPVQHASIQREIDRVFLNVELPTQVMAAIAAAADYCRDTPARALAARSSATAEDMAATSFAGQYRSFLDLSSSADLERAVRLVWASLWYPAPMAYRRFHSVDESLLAMAVVIMPMIAAERAGVAFTIDPAGSEDTVRVESVQGLGEQLVSGQTTPEVALVPRSKVLLDAEITVQDHSTDLLAARVAELALRVERAFVLPQDIEWAWDGDSLLLLQARPITTTEPIVDGDGFDTLTPEDQRWTTAGIAEMLPNTLPPLLWDTSAFLVEEGFRTLFDALGVLPEMAPGTPMIGRFRGRAALNLGLLEEMALALPGGSPEEVERQYFGRSAGERPATSSADAPESGRAGKWSSAKHDMAVLRLNHRANREAETTVAATAQILSVPLRVDLPDQDLFQLRRRLLDLAGRTIAAETAVAAAALAAYRQLEAWLTQRFEDAAAGRWAQRLTSVTRSGVNWTQLVQGAQVSNPEVVGTLAEAQTWQEAVAALKSSKVGGEWTAAILETARRAGSAAVFAGPTWDEDLDRVWAAVRSAWERQNGANPDLKTRSQDPNEVMARFLEVLYEQPRWDSEATLIRQVYDVRLLKLRRLVEDSIESLDRRERTKSAVLALGGAVRAVHLEIGRRLAAQGRLETVEDVHLLGESELEHARTGGEIPSLAELARRRRWLERCASEGSLPPLFRGRPPRTGVAAPSGATEFHGWGASAGIFTGRAVVLTDPNVALERSDVLVAQTTDASWSPLFLQAGAIVVEQGGPLSHAAIVARELGIPAVLNVPGVMAAAADRGGEITVNGDSGAVVIS